MTNVQTILTERQKTHGRWEENARISQGLLRVLRTGSRWAELADSQLEALQMISHKEHRIVNGDPNVADHWDDIAGYATLEANRLRRAMIVPEKVAPVNVEAMRETIVWEGLDLYTGPVQDVTNYEPPWPNIPRTVANSILVYYLPDRSRIDPVVVEEQLCRIAGKLPRLDYENLHLVYRSLYTKQPDGDEYVLLPEFAGWAS